jgi:hypothetical protein
LLICIMTMTMTKTMTKNKIQNRSLRLIRNSYYRDGFDNPSCIFEDSASTFSHVRHSGTWLLIRAFGTGGQGGHPATPTDFGRLGISIPTRGQIMSSTLIRISITSYGPAFAYFSIFKARVILNANPILSIPILSQNQPSSQTRPIQARHNGV